MLSLLKEFLFEKKYDYDFRQPVFNFTITSPFSDVMETTKYGFLLPSLWFWVKTLFIMSMGTLISSCISYIIYTYIIPNRKINSTKVNLIGFGVLIPFMLVLPFIFVELFQIDNIIQSFGGALFMFVYPLRCSEAMFGFSPKYVETTFKSYRMYFTCPVEVVFDKNGKPSRASAFDIQKRLRTSISGFLLVGFLISYLLPKDFVPFKLSSDLQLNFDAEANKYGLKKLAELFSVRRLTNNFIMAVLTNLCLGAGTNFLAAANGLVRGINVIDVTNNPMFGSTSPSDFWGRRWNQLVHATLKGGVFKPVRSMTDSAGIASVATFLVSGILHDYLLFLFTYTRSRNDETFNLYELCSFGNQTMFFLWNAVLILLEMTIGHWFIFQWMKHNLPKHVLGLLVVMSALPLGHLFTDEFVKMGVYQDFGLGAFGFRKV